MIFPANDDATTAAAAKTNTAADRLTAMPAQMVLG